MKRMSTDDRGRPPLRVRHPIEARTNAHAAPGLSVSPHTRARGRRRRGRRSTRAASHPDRRSSSRDLPILSKTPMRPVRTATKSRAPCLSSAEVERCSGADHSCSPHTAERSRPSRDRRQVGHRSDTARDDVEKQRHSLPSARRRRARGALGNGRLTHPPDPRFGLASQASRNVTA